MGRSGIRAAYATGRGRVMVRAKTEFEEFNKDRTRIIVTEIPYQVNKRMLIKNMADQVEDKRLEGISDIRDESDRNGMRIVIELKRDANPQVVLNRLFAQTQLQTTFAINMLALTEVNGKLQPKILSLRHILDEYLHYQRQVIIRRTQYDLRKAQERAHLLEGLLIAQDNIDEVIRIIRTSYDDAKQRLMDRFSLSDVQAQAICDMRLIALQGLNREKLEAEYKELEERIDYYNRLLASEEMQKQVLKEELLEIAEKFGDERHTDIEDVETKSTLRTSLRRRSAATPCPVRATSSACPPPPTGPSAVAAVASNAQNLKEEDYVRSMVDGVYPRYLLFFTSTGKVHRRKGYRIPEAGRTARGTAHRQHSAPGARRTGDGHAGNPGIWRGQLPVYGHPGRYRQTACDGVHPYGPQGRYPGSDVGGRRQADLRAENQWQRPNSHLHQGRYGPLLR